MQKRKFPIKYWKKAKEENSQSKIGRKQKRKKIPDTELSQVNKKRKETTTCSGPLPLIDNQDLVRYRLSRPALNKNRKRKGLNKRLKHVKNVRSV